MDRGRRRYDLKPAEKLKFKNRYFGILQRNRFVGYGCRLTFNYFEFGIYLGYVLAICQVWNVIYQRLY